MHNKLTSFIHPLVAAGLLVLAAGTASAATVGDTQYKLLKPAQPTEVAPGKVEVVEVFWYACPHCYAVQPKVEAWIKKGMPANVQYVWVPATWNELLKTHARIFYTVELLGKPQLHDDVFREINVKGNRLETPEKIEAFFVTHGVSKADFQKAFSSFAVESKIRHAEDLNRRYKITGTPTWVVAGKYVTEVSMAGSEDALFQVLNGLVAMEKPAG
ncbi:MAG: thiol:disulfide interchange protein DsbA/DsbL [Steroidobacteraceae bacterium]